MSFKHAIFAFFVVMATGFGSYVLVSIGYYPIAMVDWHIITARELERDFSAAYRYFENALVTYGADPERLTGESERKEIWRAALDKIIVDSLTLRELNRRLSKAEHQEVANTKIQNFFKSNANVADAAKTLYGLDLETFEERLLLPEARREILEGRMSLAGENFQDWLKTARANASVLILTPDLKWEGGQVKLK